MRFIKKKKNYKLPVHYVYFNIIIGRYNTIQYDGGIHCTNLLTFNFIVST